MKTAMPILPSEDHRNTQNPIVAVHQASTMCVSESGMNMIIAVVAKITRVISHSLRSKITTMLGIIPKLT
jgi:hypothetical protein